MQQNQERAYTVRGELVTIGSKRVTVRCPRKLTKMLASGEILSPIAEYFRRSKDEEDPQNAMTFFRIKAKDANYSPPQGGAMRTFELQFEVPEEVSSAIRYEAILDHTFVKLAGDESVAAQEYVADLNDALKSWCEVLKVKCDATATPITWRDLSNSGISLKWTSKTVSADSFISSFDPETSKFIITIGVGYHSSKDQKLGISLGLSMFYGTTARGAYLKKVEQSLKSNKKRKVVELDENGQEGAAVAQPEEESVA